ncbi:MAG: glycosyltransferase [Thermosynechococcaceae cyanobacterium]
MGQGTGYFKQIEKYTDQNRKYFNFFKELYKKNNLLKVEPQEIPKIPKIIHQIWIGNRQIPHNLNEYQKTWIEKNPDWEYKLWTNEEVKEYTFCNEELKFLFSQSLTLGERVDVLRYDILYQYGGIYADCDCICLKPFDIFAHRYDFFAGIFQPMFATMENAVFLQNCLVGAKPKHPIIKKIALLMHQNWDDVKNEEDAASTTLQRTFLSLTHAVVSASGQDNNIDIVMPPSYFFPIVPYPVFDLMIRGLKETVSGFFYSELAPYSSFKEYSFSHHYSSKEWLRDIYSTISFDSPIWSLFSLKDWILFLRSKLFYKNIQKKIGRETFEELMNRSKKL